MRSFVLLAILLVIGCNPPNKAHQDAESTVTLNLDSLGCASGKMTAAYYQEGSDESIPKALGKTSDFLIVVDTTMKARNFISSSERYARKQSLTLDTSDFNWRDYWNKMSISEKLALVRTERNINRRDADSIHAANNNGQQQVWIVNNTSDTIALQMQDGSFVCILQAIYKGVWKSIEYWQFSWCGNSYYYKAIPPKMANSFLAEIPNRGELKVKLRYKLLGKNCYYYSNEFEGLIDKCEFAEDTTGYTNLGRGVRTSMLDTFMQLVWEPRKVNMLRERKR